MTGCAGGTETGNPPLLARLSYQAYSSTTAVGVGASAAGARVDSVWLALGPVGFAPGAICSGSPGVSAEAPAIGVGNHASGHPVSTEFELNAGDYCAVVVPLVVADALPAGAPAALAGNSVLLTGELADGTPFELASKLTPELVLRADAGSFTLDAAEKATIVGFDVGAWLDGLELTTAERSSEGIEISAQANAELLAAFESRLESGVVLFRDRDDDGRLDDAPERLAN